MAFMEPMHRYKHNITCLLKLRNGSMIMHD